MTRQQKIKKIEDKIQEFHRNFNYYSSISVFSPNLTLNQVDDLLTKYNKLSSFTKDIKDYNKLIEIGIIIDNIYFYDEIAEQSKSNPKEPISVKGITSDLFYKVSQYEYRVLEKYDLILQSEKLTAGKLWTTYSEMSIDNMHNFCYDKTQDDMCKYLFNDLSDDTETINPLETDWRDYIIFMLCFIPFMVLLGAGIGFILKYISNLMI